MSDFSVDFHEFELSTDSGSLRLPFKIGRFVALYRKVLFWMLPFSGSGAAAVPEGTQFLIEKCGRDSFRILLPLLSGDDCAVLAGESRGLTLRFSGSCGGKPRRRACLLAEARGREPHELAERTMAAVRDRLGGFRLRGEKPVPDFIEYPGWCTWDAFYQSVTQDKMCHVLESFASGGCTPGFIILDDGHQDIVESTRQLRSFGTDRGKFPDGLAGAASEFKKRFGVRYFGVWIAMEGYWNGLDPESFASKYSIRHLEADKRVLSPWENSDGKTGGDLAAPDAVEKFFDDYLNFLSGEGVDMVKVDNQSAIEAFFAGTIGRGEGVGAYRRALEKAVKKHLPQGVINCMANGAANAFKMADSLLWRNSDDFFPRQGLAAQQHHIYANAVNALWTATFALPDYDMFRTCGSGAEIHAAARAVSGGPVYVCDNDYHDFSLLGRLVDRSGRVLRSRQPARIASDSLFGDCAHSGTLLKLTNTNPNGAVMALFNVNPDSRNRSSGTARISDVPGFKAGETAVYEFASGTVKKARQVPVELFGDEAALLTFGRIHGRFAAIGELDKYNSGAIFEKVSGNADKLEAVVRCGGRIGFYCGSKPQSIEVDGAQYRITWPRRNLLAIEIAGTTQAKVTLRT